MLRLQNKHRHPQITDESDRNTMNIEYILLTSSLAALFLAMILFVLFGQITVRKLRKNPKTKDELGIEFASGWDILNVAGALALPRWLNRKLRNSPLSYLYADADILDKNTNTFDRILATIFYGLFVFSGITLILLTVLNTLGVFD